MGLLSRASFITENVKLAFSDFVLKYGIQTFAIFEYDNSNYYIKNSIGFDGSSIITSLSTKDFWDGVCPELNKEYNFSCDNHNGNPIMQFFSFEIRDDINAISVYRTENKIFLVCNKIISKEMTDDMLSIDSSLSNVNLDNVNKNITKDSKVFLYEVDFSEAVDTYFAMKQKNQDVEKLLKQSLYNELANRFQCYYSKYSTKRISDSKVRILLVVDKTILEDHLICHMVFNLQTVIENASELISFDNKGVASSLIELKEFIQVD